MTNEELEAEVMSNDKLGKAGPVSFRPLWVGLAVLLIIVFALGLSHHEPATDAERAAALNACVIASATFREAVRCAQKYPSSEEVIRRAFHDIGEAAR